MQRRSVLKLLGATAGLAVVKSSGAAVSMPASEPFTFCLNTITIRGQNLGFIKELEIASKAGYSSVEVWMDNMQYYLQHGGTTKDIRQRLNDLGLQPENCLTLPEWIVDDAQKRRKALGQMKREMALMREIGCKHTIATAKGLTNNTTITLDTIAERYNAVLELGISMDVIPMLEMWGFQKMVRTASEVTYSAMQTGNAQAKILLDVFHLYKGNTPIETLGFINPSITEILHMNDYPASIPSSDIGDEDRIYPGDGIAPIRQILTALKRKDKPLILSVELFNKNYYKQDALTVAKTALEKMKAVVAGV